MWFCSRVRWRGVIGAVAIGAAACAGGARGEGAPRPWANPGIGDIVPQASSPSAADAAASAAPDAAPMVVDAGASGTRYCEARAKDAVRLCYATREECAGACEEAQGVTCAGIAGMRSETHACAPPNDQETCMDTKRVTITACTPTKDECEALRTAIQTRKWTSLAGRLRLDAIGAIGACGGG